MNKPAEVRIEDHPIGYRSGRNRPANLVVVPDPPALGYVAAFGTIDAVQVSDAFTMFRVLAVGDIHFVVIDHRCADQLVASLWPHRVFRIAVELPELLSGQRVVTAHPAIALSMNDLNHVADLAHRRGRPLAVQNAIKHRIVFPGQLASIFIKGNQRWGFWRRNVDVALILPVRGANVYQIAVYHRGTIRHVVRLRADLLHHVELPDYIGVVLARQLLLFVGPIVLPITKTLRVQAINLAAVRHVIEPVALYQRRGTDALIRPVVHAP